MPKISIKGVLIGSVTYLVASTALLIMGVFVLRYALSCLIDQHDTATMGNVARTFTLIMPVFAYLAALLAGYVAAYIAKHSEITNGALASIPAVYIDSFALFHQSSPHAQLNALAMIVVSIALAAFGGYLRLRQVRSKQLAG